MTPQQLDELELLLREEIAYDLDEQADVRIKAATAIKELRGEVEKAHKAGMIEAAGKYEEAMRDCWMICDSIAEGALTGAMLPCCQYWLSKYPNAKNIRQKTGVTHAK